MMGTAKARNKELGESWGTVDSSYQDDLEQSLTGDEPQPGTKGKQSKKRRANKTSQSWVGVSPGSSTSSLPPAPATRRTRQATPRTDFGEPQLVMPSPEGSFMQSPAGNRPRRRVSRNVEDDEDIPRVVPTTRRSRPMAKISRSSEPSEEPYTILAPLDWIWQNFVHPMMRILFSLFVPTFYFLQPILSIMIAVVILYATSRALFDNYFQTSLGPFVTPLTTAFTSICYIPGVAFLRLPICEPSLPKTAGPVEFDDLVRVQSSFDDILTAAIQSAGLPAEMKRSENAIRDVRTVVKYSALPSRNELSFEFDGFVSTASRASRELQIFNSNIGKAVDRILSVNKWTLQTIEHVVDVEASQGAIPRLLSNTPILSTLLSPILGPYSADTAHRVLLEQYTRHTAVIESQIATLIGQAQALLSLLDDLDANLDRIHDVTARDELTARATRDELLSDIWTLLGGRRADRARNARQLRLLDDVSRYRRSARAHVAAVILKLQAIGSELESLRERVAAPETAGGAAAAGAAGVDADDIFDAGLGVDAKGSPAAFAITLHIENIQRGVERLERQRREHSEESIRAIDRVHGIGGGSVDEGHMIGDKRG
ncbi:hypothetical protein IWZ03DRAFT_373518 [Phyllosticta citriasiana]|uniref:Uncharacterized protein n=1 Tax=Phyllosticta citriasiana TaxID=595635 RepID=A0ABR1KT06_9PEZI